MDEPKTKAELLEAMAAGREEWEEVLGQISDADLRIPGVEGSWSVKEVIAHICAYEQYMGAMLIDMKDNQANATVSLDAYYQMHLTMYRAQQPDLPENLQELHGEQVNQAFVASFRYKTPAEVRAMEAQAYQKMVDAVETYSEEELTKPFADTGGTLMQILPRQCYRHYRQHIPTIRAWLENRS